MNRQETREDQARREVGQTDISPAVARLIVTGFLLIIFGLPIAHQVTGSRAAEQGALAAGPPARGEIKRGVSARVFAANAALLDRINLYQDHLDDTFILSRKLRVQVQAVMVRFGVGNEKVYVGRKGTLFYAPGIHYLTGPGFLWPRQLKRRSREGNERSSAPQPDPVKAIVHFRGQLEQRGIELIVLPAPTKATIHPERFLCAVARRFDTPLQNASYQEFLDRLEQMQVRIFDPAPMLVSKQSEYGNGYLDYDSHWGPKALVLVAESLAMFIEEQNVLGKSSPDLVAYTRRAQPVSNAGDLARMLGASTNHAPAHAFKIEMVMEHGKRPSQNRPDADVLLLGDSFANIYSQADMGWGEDAGLAEQLSYALQRPVERLARNDAGAYATREMLATDLARGRDRLAGKKLLIWQFAARELAFGDWKLIELPEVGDAQPTGLVSANRVNGTISNVSELPENDAAYKDFVMKFYVTNLQSQDGKSHGDGVVHMLAMRNREFLPPAGLRAGSEISLSIRPWSEVEERYGSLKMGSLDDIMLEIEKPLYWGEME